MKQMLRRHDCKAIACWLGILLSGIADLINGRAVEWGQYNPIHHEDLNLMGPSGVKRRRLHKGFKNAVSIEAMEEKKSSSVSSMMRASCSASMQKNYSRIFNENVWEHKAALVQLVSVYQAILEALEVQD